MSPVSKKKKGEAADSFILKKKSLARIESLKKELAKKIVQNPVVDKNVMKPVGRIPCEFCSTKFLNDSTLKKHRRKFHEKIIGILRMDVEFNKGEVLKSLEELKCGGPGSLLRSEDVVKKVEKLLESIGKPKEMKDVKKIKEVGKGVEKFETKSQTIERLEKLVKELSECFEMYVERWFGEEMLKKGSSTQQNSGRPISYRQEKVTMFFVLY